MDFSKLPKLNIFGIVLAVVLGIIAAVLVYQAQIRGLIPTLNTPLENLSLQETRTIVQEENAVISVVEKTSPSIVTVGVGNGFIVSQKGIIVTNKHTVAEETGQLNVVTKDGQKYEVRKVYRDPVLDLAIVQVDATDLKQLDFGDSSKLKVGQTVIALGNIVTTGIVSGLGRKTIADDLISTDAVINPGNSGGPLLNSAGQVIGVNVVTTMGIQNTGFAVPVNYVKKAVNEFIDQNTVARPFLGIRYKFVAKDMVTLNEVPQGVLIQEVVDDSPAAKVGILAGDIITKIDNQTVDSESKVSQTIHSKKINDQLDLTIWNNGKEKTVTAILTESPSQ